MNAVKKLKKWKIFLIAVLCLAALVGAEIYRSARCLTVSHYEVQSKKVQEQIRIVQLTDLHNAEFGDGNEQLLALVAEQKPDLILFTGDLVTGYVKETGTAMDLVEQLTQIAPVYVSIGNHEQMHQSNFGSDLVGMLEYRGATVLEYEYEDIEVNGQPLRIGGISGFGLAEIYLETGEARQRECDFLKEFQDTSSCTLLMAHIPAGWLESRGLEEWDVDLVFSGHVHGGQTVLPLIGGVYGPDMGFFPGRLEGLFKSEDGEKTLVLSSGLGNSSAVPRFNNPPQVLVLDILPK